MKKFFMLLFSVLLVLSLYTTAWAEEYTEIDNYADLKVALESVPTATSATTITLKANESIDMSQWVALDISGEFTLNGNGATLTGLAQPLFQHVGGTVTIQNLTISDATLTVPFTAGDGEYSSAAIVAWIRYGANVTISNCSAENVTISGDDGFFGGLVGYFETGDDGKLLIDGCNVSGCTISSVEGAVGGIIGHTNGGTEITNSTVSQNTLIMESDSAGKIGVVLGTNVSGETKINVTETNRSSVSVNGTVVDAPKICGRNSATLVFTGGEYFTDPAITDPVHGTSGTASKGQYVHVHQWAAEWASDADYHWHECVTADCHITDSNIKDGYGLHTVDSDDGDCTTPVVCSTCNYEVTKASGGHVPGADDDGDCTTPALCGNPGCTKYAPAAPNHVPGTDDGDCTTDVLCGNEGCKHVMIAAKTHTPQDDDNDCSTPVYCANDGCTQVVIEALSHTPGADDGDCTTDVLCGNEGCTHVMTAANAAHTFTNKASTLLAAQADCTNKAKYFVQCDLCQVVSDSLTVEVGETLPHDWDSAWTSDDDNHWHVCTSDGCTETKDIAAHVSSGDNVATYISKAKCDVCGVKYGTVKKWFSRPTQSTPTTPTAPTTTVESPKTFDAGIALYAGMALTSAMGAAYVMKKK